MDFKSNLRPGGVPAGRIRQCAWYSKMASDDGCVFCLCYCTIGFYHISFAHVAVVLTKECIIELIFVYLLKK